MRWKVRHPQDQRQREPDASKLPAPAPPSDATPYPSSPLCKQVDSSLPAVPSWRAFDTCATFYARDQTILMDPLVEEEKGEEWKHFFPEVSEVVEFSPEIADLVLWATLPAMTSPLPLCTCPPPPLSELMAHGGLFFPPPKANGDLPSSDDRDWEDLLATLPPEALEPVPVPKKRKRKEEKGAYVKKPPNAFMLFLRSERKTVQEDLGIRNSASVNKVLSERWKSMPAEKRQIFEAEAQVESYIHALKHPEWSNKVNYGKTSKKSWTKAPLRPPPSC